MKARLGLHRVDWPTYPLGVAQQLLSHIENPLLVQTEAVGFIFSFDKLLDTFSNKLVELFKNLSGFLREKVTAAVNGSALPTLSKWQHQCADSWQQSHSTTTSNIQLTAMI